MLALGRAGGTLEQMSFSRHPTASLNSPVPAPVFHIVMTNTLTQEGKLRRQNGIVAGVCGGLGEFYGIKPIWFRILFLLLMLPGGFPGVLTYLVMWLAVPKR